MKHQQDEYQMRAGTKATFTLTAFGAQDIISGKLSAIDQQCLIDIATSRLVDAGDELGLALCRNHQQQLFDRVAQHDGFVYVLSYQSNQKIHLAGSAFALTQQRFALNDDERENVHDHHYDECNYAQKVRAWYNLITPYLEAKTTSTLALYTLTINKTISTLFNPAMMSFIRESIAQHAASHGYLAMTLAAPKSSTFNGFVSDRAQTVLPTEFVDYVVEPTGEGNIQESAVKPLLAVQPPTVMSHSMFRQNSLVSQETTPQDGVSLTKK